MLSHQYVYIKLLRTSVLRYAETSHLDSMANEMLTFYVKGNIYLNPSMHIAEK